VSAADQALARLNATNALTALRLIAPPLASAAALDQAMLVDSLLAEEQFSPGRRRRAR
jgi:hypothetical protein